MFTLHKKKKVFEILGAVIVNLEPGIKTLEAWYYALLSLYARLLNGCLTMKINTTVLWKLRDYKAEL